MSNNTTSFWTEASSKTKLVIAAVVVIILVLLFRSCSTEDFINEDSTFNVKRGPLTISVSESGTIKAREQVVIKSELEGRITILSLVSEGTQVKKGDLLIELDVSPLREKLVDQQIRVENNEAGFVRTREDFAVAKSKADSEISKAELDLDFAKQDLEKYTAGEYPNQLSQSEAKITVSKEELGRAEEKYKWSKILHDEKYLSQTELKADELAAKKARLNLQSAIAEKDLLENYTHKRKIAELESEVEQKQKSLERIERTTKADIIQAEADLKAKESEFHREQGKLDKITQQISKSKIYAPSDGLVVYATSNKGPFRFNDEPLAEGREVMEREELIYLPSPGSTMAEIKIHESNLDKVRQGMPVRVTMDALPGQVYKGKINSIAPLPDSSGAWLGNDLKLYNTDVYLETASLDLRTGMSCQAEILVAHYDDVLYLPVQAVVSVKGQSTVYVRDGSDFEPRQVEVGLDNNRMVHVIEGLEEGEEVSLTPPFSDVFSDDAEESPLDDDLKDLINEVPAADLSNIAPNEKQIPVEPKLNDDMMKKMLDKMKSDSSIQLPPNIEDKLNIDNAK